MPRWGGWRYCYVVVTKKKIKRTFGVSSSSAPLLHAPHGPGGSATSVQRHTHTVTLRPTRLAPEVATSNGVCAAAPCGIPWFAWALGEAQPCTVQEPRSVPSRMRQAKLAGYGKSCRVRTPDRHNVPATPPRGAAAPPPEGDSSRKSRSNRVLREIFGPCHASPPRILQDRSPYHTLGA